MGITKNIAKKYTYYICNVLAFFFEIKNDGDEIMTPIPPTKTMPMPF